MPGGTAPYTPPDRRSRRPRPGMAPIDWVSVSSSALGAPVVNSAARQTWYGREDQRMRDGAAVPQPNEVLIGLDVGTASIEAVAFAPDGHELARAP